MDGLTTSGVPLRMALCARISDEDKQGDNYSAPDQLDRMRGWCLAQIWSVALEHEFIEKDSAFIDGLDRPELNKMSLATTRRLTICSMPVRVLIPKLSSDGMTHRQMSSQG
jgi:hypothetical protein